MPRNTKLADLLLTLVAMSESSATKQKCVVVDTFEARVREKDQAPEFLRQHGSAERPRATSAVASPHLRVSC